VLDNTTERRTIRFNMIANSLPPSIFVQIRMFLI
jgi:hypothetical protein